MTALVSHPRLYASPESLNRLHDIPDKPPFQGALAYLEKINAQCVAGEELIFREGHNSLLNRARVMQGRAVSLAALWWKTRDEDTRSAIFDCVKEIGDWEYWSWLAMRKGETDPAAVYDLSCGENCATLAILYDWLFDSLSDEERELFREIATRRGLVPFLKKTEPDQWNNFFGRSSSNWNAVCTGGTGMLALAMFEELPEAEEVLARVETSLVPFMQHLEETSGGWPEGLGYWNYGMRYAFMYLRSWENAHGQEHPLLQIPAAQRTLHFPLDFSPNGCACSFGDVGAWMPLPFHFEMADRFDDTRLLARLNAAWDQQRRTPPFPRSPWPDAAELLIFHPRREADSTEHRQQIVELYEGLDWGILADQMPDSSLYAAVRGGSSQGGHSHRDLLSFHCVVGDEKMIENVGVNEYLDSTFSKRRNEIFEIGPASKNTLFINGLGISLESSVQTKIENYQGLRGIRMDATEAMGPSPDNPVALFCGRVFLLLKENALLIVDRVNVVHPARIEARFFTPHPLELNESTALLQGKRQSLQMVFAADKPAVLVTAQPPMTSPLAAPYNMLRWSTRDVTPQGITFATLLVPRNQGNAQVSISEENDGGFTVRAHIGSEESSIAFMPDLMPRGEES